MDELRTSPQADFLYYSAALAVGNCATAARLLKRLQAHHPWLALVAVLPAAIAALEAGNPVDAAMLLTEGGAEEAEAFARAGTKEWPLGQGPAPLNS